MAGTHPADNQFRLKSLDTKNRDHNHFLKTYRKLTLLSLQRRYSFFSGPENFLMVQLFFGVSKFPQFGSKIWNLEIFLTFSENHLSRGFEDVFFISKNEIPRISSKMFLNISSIWHIFQNFLNFWLWKLRQKKLWATMSARKWKRFRVWIVPGPDHLLFLILELLWVSKNRLPN